MMPAVRSDPAPALERCFLFDAVEDDYQVVTDGHLPAWLRGSYYVNGPARFTRGDFRYRHWLDGDGMVCALHVSDRGVRFVNRFVQTTKLSDEEAAGRPLYRTFGTAFDGDRLRHGLMLEAPVNVSVYPFAGTLLAFGEQSLPVALDPVTLETVGEYDFHGRLNGVSPFAAHAKIEPSTGHLVNFGIGYSASAPSLTIYEFDPAGRLLDRRRQRLDLPHSNHDFGLTRRHAVFFLNPLVIDVSRLLSGSSLIDAFSWLSREPARLLIVPRGPERHAALSIEVSAGCCLHQINAWEDGDDLVVDLLEMDGPIYPQYQPIPDLFATAPLGRPVRYRVDLRAGAVVDRTVIAYDRTPDFPSLDPRLGGAAYDEFWMLGISAAGIPGPKFFDQLARASWRESDVVDRYQLEPGQYFAGEPIVVFNPHDGTEAVVIVQHLDAGAGTAAFAVYDAFGLARGPIARLPLRHRIHPGFHASFLRRAN